MLSIALHPKKAPEPIPSSPSDKFICFKFVQSLKHPSLISLTPAGIVILSIALHLEKALEQVKHEMKTLNEKVEDYGNH